MFTRMVKMTKYEQNCKRKHNVLAAEALKLEIMAFLLATPKSCGKWHGISGTKQWIMCR